MPLAESCEIVLGAARMGVAKEFKNLGTVLCSHKEMDGVIWTWRNNGGKARDMENVRSFWVQQQPSWE